MSGRGVPKTWPWKLVGGIAGGLLLSLGLIELASPALAAQQLACLRAAGENVCDHASIFPCLLSGFAALVAGLAAAAAAFFRPRVDAVADKAFSGDPGKPTTSGLVEQISTRVIDAIINPASRAIEQRTREQAK